MMGGRGRGGGGGRGQGGAAAPRPPPNLEIQAAQIAQAEVAAFRLLGPAPCDWAKVDVGEWWLEMRAQGRFKHMEMLALEYLAIPATKAPSERVFSRAGRELLDGRHRSGADMIRSRTFLATSLETLDGLGKRPRSV